MRIHLLLIALFSVAQVADACTAFQLRANDGAWIYCRSMEFGYPMGSDLLIVPRGTEFVGSAPNSQKGVRWKAKYGFAGLNQKAVPTVVVDGMNEAGLVVGLLYMPGFAKFQTVEEAQYGKSLGPWEVSNYLLSNCASIKEVKSLIESIYVAEVAPPGFNGFVVPLHYYVSDKNGDVLIVEYLEGKRKLYDNPLGVLTNSPPFDWHLNNLANYVNLSPVNASALVLGDSTIRNFGQGSGLLGLPGDYTPPSRFVRAALFSHWTEQRDSAEETVNLGFHLLNTFDIFDGIIRDPKQSSGKPPPGEVHSDMTEWVVVNDQTNRVIYYRGYESLQIEKIDLKKLDFTKPGFRKIEMSQTFAPEDVTSQSVPTNF